MRNCCFRASSVRRRRSRSSRCICSRRDPGRRIRTRDGRCARRPAPAGPRGASPGEEQPPGRGIADQHPWPQRRDARTPAPPTARSAAASARWRSFTATISPRWRRIAGSRFARCCRSSPRRFAPQRPRTARGLRIELDLEGAHTTQDVAVSVAFLVTEIVEFAMLRTPEDPVEISLRRTSELTARLTLNSKVLIPTRTAIAEKVQFERIISGLAKQLRSTLERKLGRYSVELPVFPDQLGCEVVTAVTKKVSPARNRYGRRRVLLFG